MPSIAVALRRKYRGLQKKYFLSRSIKETSKEIVRNCARGNKTLRKDLERAIEFASAKFRGKYRQDGKTHLFLHSLFLLAVLKAFGEKQPETYLAAMLHDVLEDTAATKKELRSLKFRSTPGKNVASYVEALSQNKSISDKPQGKSVISPRVRNFIKRLKNSPSPIINVELADRVHDLLDLDYLKTLKPAEARSRLNNKIKRGKTIVAEITRGRKDFNKRLFKFSCLLSKSTFQNQLSRRRINLSP